MKSKALPLYLTILFILISTFNLILAINHEYWRDEAQAWLIARDCTLTPDSLFTVTSYEGHPFLWFLMLMPFAKLGVPFDVLKYISWGIMTVSLFIFLFRTDIPSWLKALVSLTPTYICFFVVPARSYSLASLLIVCISVMYKKRKDRPIIYSILLSMLLQTLIIMGGFVAALGIAWFIETLVCLIKKKADKTTLIKNIAGLFFLLANALFLLWEFRYIPGSSSNATAHTLIKAFVKLAGQYKYGYKILFGNIYIIAMILINASIVGLFITNKKARIPLLLAGSGILWQIFIYAFIYVNPNHRSLTWVYLLLFVAIVSYDKRSAIYSSNNLFISIVIISLLLSWNYICMDHLINDLRNDMAYSYSKETADVINDLPEDTIILSLSQIRDTSLTARLYNNQFVYNIITGSKASFTDRNPEEQKEPITTEEFFEKVHQLFSDKKTVYAIVANDECNVIGIEEYIKKPHSNIAIAYESQHKYITEDFTLIAIYNK